MKNLKRLIFVFLIVLGIYFYFKDPEAFQRETTDLNKKEVLLEKKEQIQNPLQRDYKIALDEWIGQSVDQLIEKYGDPIRKDLSEYNYTSYVYMDELNSYLSFGIEKDKIVTVLGTGRNLDLGTFKIGDTYEDVLNKVDFEKEISFRRGTSMYTIKLTEEDLLTRPISQIDQNNFIQFYFDIINNHLIAVRILTADTLLMHGGFDIFYRGQLPEKQQLSAEEQSLIARNKEKQIVDITNIFREFYGKRSLQISESVQTVAFLHSEDMARNDYFSHESKSGKTLADRLSEQNISFKLAGENIAFNYIDALAVVVGWLNSEGHRESLLNDEFTHIGVGVYKSHYTQNFIKN